MGCEWGFGTWVNRLSLDFSRLLNCFIFQSHAVRYLLCICYRIGDGVIAIIVLYYTRY